MDIKVGEYIRTSAGKIDKITNNNYYIPQYVICEKGIVDKENIVNHSKDLIDLIEVGDYVNGKRVSMLKGEVDLSDIDNENDFCYTNYSDEYGKWYGFREDEVESILTHEQFEANCYKIEQK